MIARSQRRRHGAVALDTVSLFVALMAISFLMRSHVYAHAVSLRLMPPVADMMPPLLMLLYVMPASAICAAQRQDGDAASAPYFSRP